MRSTFQIGELTKGFVKSAITSSLPAEEILKQLESYGVEWYVTERGDLMIRYWQIGAERFASPEVVARIRQRQQVPAEADTLEWLSESLAELGARYAGRWIAVVKNQVIADAPDLAELLVQIRESGIEHPFITQIPLEPVVWTTAYAR